MAGDIALCATSCPVWNPLLLRCRSQQPMEGTSFVIRPLRRGMERAWHDEGEGAPLAVPVCPSWLLLKNVDVLPRFPYELDMSLPSTRKVESAAPFLVRSI